MTFLGDLLQSTANTLNSFGIQTPELGLTEAAGGTTVKPVTQTAFNTAWNSVPSGSGGGTSSGGDVLGSNDSTASPTYSAAPAYSAEDLAYIDDQIAQLTGQKARIGAGLQTGLTGLEDSYNKNLSEQNLNRSRALEDFDMKTEDTTRNKNAAIGRVNTNARVLSDSLRRRLGMAGGSDSSAYNITAPGAVARDASADRTGVVEDFGVNFRNLDVAKKRADTDFASLLEDLSAQRRNSERGLRQGILEQENQVDTSLADAARQRAGLLGGGYNAAKLASAGYETGINNRNSQIDSLFSQYRNPYTIKPVDVQKVNLRDYLVDKAAIQTNQQNNTQDPYAPYSPTIQKQDDEYQF